MKRCVLDIETTGLEPWKDRIVCIGIRDVDEPKTVVFLDEKEEALMKRFSAYCERKQFKEVIGYNISFDMRFLFVKCLKYELKAGGLFLSTFTDVMDNMRAVRKMYSYNKPGKLQDWVQFLFGTSKLEKGDAVAKLFENREFTRIIDYNRQDVDLTYQLWKRIQVVLCRQ